MSWPTAETTNISDWYIASITSSSLKAHKSSIDPPPLPTINTSKLYLSWLSLKYFIPSAISYLAFLPCTFTG